MMVSYSLPTAPKRSSDFVKLAQVERTQLYTATEKQTVHLTYLHFLGT